MAKNQSENRRSFLGKVAAGASAAVCAPYFVPARALGGDGVAPPSDRIVMGVIGSGGMGRGNLGAFMAEPDVQAVAVCDVDAGHLKEGVAQANEHYGDEGCTGYDDFRNLLEHPGLDAVVVATPDHWHAVASIAALKAGKDVYCEKPLANSVGEGRAICDAVKESGRILQVGSHERSNPKVRFACELVRNGILGKIHTITGQMPCDQPHHMEAKSYAGPTAPQTPPEGFAYDFWLGPAAKAPYYERRCHFWWRFILAYGGGEMTDRGAHILDLAQLALDMDDSGPVEYRGEGKPAQSTLYDACFDFDFENVYPNGVKLVGSSSKSPRGIRFEGDEGSLFVHIHGGELEATPRSLLDVKISDDEVQLGRTPSHRRNFLDCVKSREQPFATAETGHRTASLCHINNIAFHLGRPLKWDPKTEQFAGDDEANAMLMHNIRAPWSV